MPESFAFSDKEKNKKLNAQHTTFCIMTQGVQGITGG
jgi:hypothetical protein